MNEPQSVRPSFVTPRPSACPGLLRIVPARDGGICRIKLAGGVLGAAQARAVALAAQTHAHGVIEVTNRANLQIRGIDGDRQALVAELMATGLGPANPASDDVRNLMLSPSAGIDPQMLFDTRPLAAQILASLESRTRLHELSPKFAVLLDGGEGLAMLEHPHDLWLSARQREGQVWLGFGLAGCPAHDLPLATVPLAHGHALVMAVLELFLDLATPEQTRMRHLLQQVPTARVLEHLQQRLPVALGGIDGWQRPAMPAYRYLGVYPQADAQRVAVGAAVPLGRLDDGLLCQVAELAEAYGDGSLRLTPWQSLLLPNVPAGQGEALRAALQALGLATSAQQPMARLVACTGSPGCARGLADTKADAVRLAASLPADAALHLSGCGRSCAAAHVAPLTLLAVAPGRYDLYQRDAQQPGFGTLRARHLTIEAVGAQLAADSRSSTA